MRALKAFCMPESVPSRSVLERFPRLPEWFKAPDNGFLFKHLCFGQHEFHWDSEVLRSYCDAVYSSQIFR